MAKSQRQWEFQANPICKNLYSGVKIYLNAESEYDYLEAEIIRSSSGTNFYVNLLFMQALPHLKDPLRTKLDIYFEDSQTSLTIYPLILQGGQRLLLSEEDGCFLIDELLQGRSFKIKLSRHELNVITKDFCKCYFDLQKAVIKSFRCA